MKTTKFPKPKKRCRAADHLDFLSLLGRCKNKNLREKLVDLANKGQIEAVLECIDNVNNQNVTVPPDYAKKLLRHRKLVQHLKSPRLNLQTKKDLLAQSGGFLGALIPLAISAVGGLINTITGRK
jgi:hypothetical protein